MFLVRIFTCLIFLVASFIAQPAQAQRQDNIVLLPLEVPPALQSKRDLYAAAIQNALRTKFNIFYGPAVEEALRREMAKTDCSAESCVRGLAVEFNGEIVVDAVIEQLGSSYVLSLKFNNVLTGELEESILSTCDNCSQGELFKFVRQQAAMADLEPQVGMTALLEGNRLENNVEDEQTNSTPKSANKARLANDEPAEDGDTILTAEQIENEYNEAKAEAEAEQIKLGKEAQDNFEKSQKKSDQAFAAIVNGEEPEPEPKKLAQVITPNPPNTRKKASVDFAEEKEGRNWWLYGIGALALAGGGGGGGGGGGAPAPDPTPDPTPDPLEQLDGDVVKGPLQGATVFLDYNDNGELDTGEPFTLTDSNGSYSFRVANANAPIVVVTDENTVDTSSGEVMSGLVLKAPQGSTVITPVTTLFADGQMSEAEVKASLGIASDVDIKTFNPFEADANSETAVKLEKFALQIVSSANAIASVAEDEGIDQLEASKRAFAAIIDSIEEKAEDGEQFDFTAQDDLAKIREKAESELGEVIDMDSDKRAALRGAMSTAKSTNDTIDGLTSLDGEAATNIFKSAAAIGANIEQKKTADSDNDGIPDLIDFDRDNDGVEDFADLFPDDASESVDLDGDGVGDNADTDRDGDGVANDADAFPEDNTETADLDNDGVGDNSDPDRDGDGVANGSDAFPEDATETADLDGDGTGDNADTDRDGDGVANNSDAFPEDANETADLDGDNIGDNADTDRDGDGVANSDDIFPDDASEYVDSDGDGIGDNEDVDNVATFPARRFGYSNGFTENDHTKVEDVEDGYHYLTLRRNSGSDERTRIEGGLQEKFDGATSDQSWEEANAENDVTSRSHVKGYENRSGTYWGDGLHMLIGDYDGGFEPVENLVSDHLTFGVFVHDDDRWSSESGSAETIRREVAAFFYGDEAPSGAYQDVASYTGNDPEHAGNARFRGKSVGYFTREGLNGGNPSAWTTSEIALTINTSEQTFKLGSYDTRRANAMFGTMASDGALDFNISGQVSEANILSVISSDEQTVFNDDSYFSTSLIPFEFSGRLFDENGLTVGGAFAFTNWQNNVLARYIGAFGGYQFDADFDGDGVKNGVDWAVADADESSDSDGDGTGDNADAFPDDASETTDTDGDGVGDNGDSFPQDENETADADGDGVGDNADVFDNDPTEWANTDGDSFGDNSDPYPSSSSVPLSAATTLNGGALSNNRRYTLTHSQNRSANGSGAYVQTIQSVTGDITNHSSTADAQSGYVDLDFQINDQGKIEYLRLESSHPDSEFSVEGLPSVMTFDANKAVVNKTILTWFELEENANLAHSYWVSATDNSSVNQAELITNNLYEEDGSQYFADVIFGLFKYDDYVFSFHDGRRTLGVEGVGSLSNGSYESRFRLSGFSTGQFYDAQQYDGWQPTISDIDVYIYPDIAFAKVVSSNTRIGTVGPQSGTPSETEADWTPITLNFELEKFIVNGSLTTNMVGSSSEVSFTDSTPEFDDVRFADWSLELYGEEADEAAGAWGFKQNGPEGDEDQGKVYLGAFGGSNKTSIHTGYAGNGATSIAGMREAGRCCTSVGRVGDMYRNEARITDGKIDGITIRSNYDVANSALFSHDAPQNENGTQRIELALEPGSGVAYQAAFDKGAGDIVAVDIENAPNLFTFFQDSNNQNVPAFHRFNNILGDEAVLGQFNSASLQYTVFGMADLRSRDTDHDRALSAFAIGDRLEGASRSGRETFEGFSIGQYYEDGYISSREWTMSEVRIDIDWSATPDEAMLYSDNTYTAAELNGTWSRDNSLDFSVELAKDASASTLSQSTDMNKVTMNNDQLNNYNINARFHGSGSTNVEEIGGSWMFYGQPAESGPSAYPYYTAAFGSKRTCSGNSCFGDPQ